MKALKWVGIGLAGLVAIAALAVGVLLARFDPDAYKPEIQRLVKEKTGRTLRIEGTLGLSFYPNVGVTVGKASLSGLDASRGFASIEQARVSVAVMPLLSQRLVVDQVLLAGLRLDLARAKDGKTNFDDLAGGQPARAADQKAAPSSVQLDVAGVELRDAQVDWRDERDGTQLRVSGLNVKTGRIASGESGKLALSASIEGSKPKMALKVQLATGYRADFATGAAALNGLDLKLDGDAPGLAGLSAQLRGDVQADPAAKLLSLSGIDLVVTAKDGLDVRASVPKLSLSPDKSDGQAAKVQVKLARPDGTVQANLSLAALQSRGRVISFPSLELDLDLKQGDLTARGKLATPLTLDLDQSVAQASGLAGEFTVAGPTVPNKSLKVAVSGSASTDWARQSAGANLAIKSDETNAQAKVTVSRFAPLAMVFDANVDKLNVDHYLPPKKPASGGAPAPGGASDKPIDLSALKGKDVSGTIRVGQLVASGVKVEALQVGIKLAAGRLDLSPLSAKLYEGSASGSASVNASNNQFALKQSLTGIAIGPLLRDAAGKDVLEGRGNVTLDVLAMGNLVPALKKSLGGTASLVLRDGAIKGVNLGEMARNARAMLGAKTGTEQGANSADKTDFSELSASFSIAKGIATNKDLSAKSPFVRLAGEGAINIGEDSMDYLARPTLVATAGGQGGRDAKDVSGLTIPVRIVGPFTALKFRPDLAAAASEMAKGKLGDAAQKAGAQVKEQAREQVQDRLKNLFKR